MLEVSVGGKLLIRNEHGKQVLITNPKVKYLCTKTFEKECLLEKFGPNIKEAKIYFCLPIIHGPILGH